MGCAALLALAFSGSEWRWIEPKGDLAFEHAPLRALPLSPQLPADLVVRATPRGRARFAQLRFGAPDSRRVALLLDTAADGSHDLWVDADRDRAIEGTERAVPTAGGWVVALAVDGFGTDAPTRDVLFHVGRSGIVLSCAVVGCLEGETTVAGRKVMARRVDGNANGLLNDLEDALWLDLDGSGDFDPLEERFACAPLLQIRQARYVLRSDELGDSLALEEVRGTGRLRLVPDLREGTKVRSIFATLAMRDGSAFRASGAVPEIELPAGDYRVQALTLELESGSQGGSTRYVFTRRESGLDANWRALPAGGELTFDPLGALSFGVALAPEGGAAPGGAIDVRPRLTSSEGLSIVSAATADAQIRLLDLAGRQLGAASSGFA